MMVTTKDRLLEARGMDGAATNEYDSTQILGDNDEQDIAPVTNASSSSSGSSFPTCLLPIVPEKCRIGWTVINHSLTLSGCILIIEVWYADKYGTSTIERPFAQAFYLIWEFAICFFWIAESGLSASYQRCHLHNNLKWYHWLELLIAAYFVISTGWMLCEWDLWNYDASILSVAVDTSFYMYLSMRNCTKSNSSNPSHDGVTIPMGDFEHGTDENSEAEGAYRRIENGGNLGSLTV